MVIIALACACASQTKITTDSTTTTLCWTGTTDTAASYILYYRDYVGSDTSWKVIGTTKKQEYTLTKGSRRQVVFGVRCVLYYDTSEMHLTTDSTACLDRSACGLACAIPGGWFLDWKLRRPHGIKVRR